MRIGLIGNIVADEITMSDGSLTKSWGGAYYSIAIFEKLLKANERLIPLTPVGYDVWDELQSDLKKFIKVDSSALYQANDKNNKVYLKYLDSNEREERAEDILPPIEVEKFDYVMDADALLFTFISGFDITLETLVQVRKNFNGKMLMDLHSLTLGIDERGFRYKRIPKDWKKWVFCFDCVQMNRVEADLLIEFEDDFSSHSELAKYLLTNGIEVVNITLGKEGSLVAILEGEKMLLEQIDSEKNIEEVDPTGCGDAYFAVFGLEYVRGSHPIEAAKKASRIAAVASTLRGVEEINLTDFNLYDA